MQKNVLQFHAVRELSQKSVKGVIFTTTTQAPRRLSDENNNHAQGRRHTFLAGEGDAFQRSLSGRISGMACVFYGTDK